MCLFWSDSRSTCSTPHQKPQPVGLYLIGNHFFSRSGSRKRVSSGAEVGGLVKHTKKKGRIKWDLPYAADNKLGDGRDKRLLAPGWPRQLGNGSIPSAVVKKNFISSVTSFALEFAHSRRRRRTTTTTAQGRAFCIWYGKIMSILPSPTSAPVIVIYFFLRAFKSDLGTSALNGGR